MKYKILVTEGTGFIGKNFIKFLLKKKIFQIYSLSTTKVRKDLREKNVNYIACRLENEDLLKKKINYNFDYVVNFAGYIDHSNSKETFSSHYVGLKNLVKTIKYDKLKKFIQIGSSVEYGFSNSPQKETLKINISKLKSIYGKSKLKSTYFLIDQYRKKKLPIIILRPYLIFGPGQNDSRLIPFIIKNCLLNKSFDCSHGKQLRNFFYIKDFVSVVYKCLEIKVNGQIINVGSRKNYTVKFIIGKINQIIKKGSPEYGKLKLRKDEPKFLYPNLTKFKKLLNLKREVSIDIGLKQTIKYYRSKIK